MSKPLTVGDVVKVLNALQDLHKQATTEHSHYYTAKVITQTIGVLMRLSVVAQVGKKGEA